MSGFGVHAHVIVIMFVCSITIADVAFTRLGRISRWEFTVFFLFLFWDWEIRIIRIIFWFPLHIRIGAVRGFIFTVELLRCWWSQSTELIFRESGQDHHCFFCCIQKVRTVLYLCLLAGSYTCRGNRPTCGIRDIFCEEKRMDEFMACRKINILTFSSTEKKFINLIYSLFSN